MASITPYSGRSCTDVLFLLLFVGCWGVIGYMTSQAVKLGDPSRLSFTHGRDMNGSVCGVSEDVKDRPYAAWPFPTQYEFMVCLSNCSQTTNDSSIALPVPSEAVLYYCMPDPAFLLNITQQLNLTAYDTNNPYLQSATNSALMAVGDIVTVWPVIAGSAGISIALSFVWLIVLQLFAGVIVYALLAAVLTGGALSGYALLLYAQNHAQSPTLSSQQVHLMQYSAYALLALTALFALVIFALRQRIRIAIQVIKEASRALSAIRSLVFFPLLPIACFGLFAAGWLTVALYLYSVGSNVEVETPAEVLYDFYSQQRNGNPALSVQFQWDLRYQRWFALHCFMLLWSCEFLIYLTFTTLSGAVADWYFTPHSASQTAVQVRPAHGTEYSVDKQPHRMSRFPIISSLCRTLRFHLGTVLVGALIIAIIQSVRAVLAYLQSQSKGRNNRVQQAVFGCLQCCLSCLQSLIDKVNRNALIWCAVYGDGFVASVSGSFQLIWANLFRVAAINVVSHFLFFLGKVVIAAASTGLSLLIMTRVSGEGEAQVGSLFVPLVCVFAVSFVVASLFMTVFSCCVDTVFLCFLIDCQENERDGCMLASDGLRQLVQHHAQASMSEAKARNEALQQQPHSAQVQMAPPADTHP
jgi:hypothetical protein